LAINADLKARLANTNLRKSELRRSAAREEEEKKNVLQERAKKQIESYTRELTIRYSNLPPAEMRRVLNEAIDFFKKDIKINKKYLLKVEAELKSINNAEKGSDLLKLEGTLLVANLDELLQLQNDNISLKNNLNMSGSQEINTKLEQCKDNERRLEEAIRAKKREIERLKIKYESNF